MTAHTEYGVSQAPATRALFVVVCLDSVKRQAKGLTSALQLEISLNPELDTVVHIAGPDIAPTGLRRLTGRSIATRVKQTFIEEIPYWSVGASDRLLLGVVVFGIDTAQVTRVIEDLTSAKELVSLALQIRGLSLDGAVTVDSPWMTSVPSAALVRPDGMLMRIIAEAVGSAEANRLSLLSVGHVTALTSAEPNVSRPVSQPGDGNAPPPGALRGAQDNRYISSPTGSPIDVLYLAVANGIEVRSRRLRARVSQLAVGIDRAMHEESISDLGQTWVLEMGMDRDPIVATAGEFRADQLESPASRHIDLVAEVRRVSRMVTEVTASYDRREQAILRPAVVFITPQVAASGSRLIREINQLRLIAEPYWVVVGDEAESGLRRIPPDRMILDKPDVVNEVVHQIGQNRAAHSEEGPDTQEPQPGTAPRTDEDVPRPVHEPIRHTDSLAPQTHDSPIVHEAQLDERNGFDE